MDKKCWEERKERGNKIIIVSCKCVTFEGNA